LFDVQIFSNIRKKGYLRSHGVTPAEIARASWRKSTYSNLNGSCVELTKLSDDRVGLRDTKDDGVGPVLIFTGMEWNAFIAGAKDGQFDNL
jgi:Domain of unknown function (DUF397)